MSLDLFFFYVSMQWCFWDVACGFRLSERTLVHVQVFVWRWGNYQDHQLWYIKFTIQNLCRLNRYNCYKFSTGVLTLSTSQCLFALVSLIKFHWHWLKPKKPYHDMTYPFSFSKRYLECNLLVHFVCNFCLSNPCTAKTPGGPSGSSSSQWIALKPSLKSSKRLC